MKILSPKKQEIRARGENVLTIARALLLERGYHGLTMARIAQAADCAKATIYQHYPCKEEIIVALALESVEIQRGLVERAATFQGRPRERMLAVGLATELFAELYEDASRVFQIVNGEAILSKVSEESIWRLRSCGLRTVDVLLGIIRDAVAQGDLVLPPGHRAEDLIYHFWLLGEGGKAAAHTWLPPKELGVESPFVSIHRTAAVMGDGYGWRPLTTEWDYAESGKRIWREVFPAEWRRLHGHRATTLDHVFGPGQTGESAPADQRPAPGKEGRKRS